MLTLARSTLARVTVAGWALALLPLVFWPDLGRNLMSTAGFEGHGHALLWRPSLVALHLGMDGLIAGSYVTISATLGYLVHAARRDIPFHWIFLAFGLFIVACGVTHMMHAVVLWYPVFWLEGYLKYVTAVASLFTAVVLPPLVPKALALVRAAQLSETRRLELEQANAELEAKNAQQETFVYTVSHDLRAPLLAIEGMADLLGEAVKANDAEEAAFMLGRVTANVQKMGDLLSDLLALSRASREVEPPQPLDLGPVAVAVLADLEPRLKDRGVLLELPSHWPTVVYGRTDAYQVLLNLVSNAAKFAGRPGEAPQVTASWEREGDWVTLKVSDNGPGVAAEYREKVFELFQKLDASADGTGVGLAIVKRIAERHLVAGKPGRVWVEDSPPTPEGLGGATFAVRMPAA